MTDADEPQLGWDDATKTFIVHVDEEWIVSVAPLIFNDRVYLTSRDEYPYSWTAAWCYDKGAAAGLAALMWDLETEWEPAGHKKVAGDSRRKTPLEKRRSDADR